MIFVLNKFPRFIPVRSHFVFVKLHDQTIDNRIYV